MGLPKVAYFSMEIALDQSLSTYSGGLGFLAGSHMLSAGYLQLPMVGVTMLWSYGYYNQRINEEGNVDVAYIRKHYDFLQDVDAQVTVKVFGEDVIVKAYRVDPDLFGSCPVYLLTTDIEENSEWARSISHKLYDGNEKIRIAQETILGVGGIRLLQAIKYDFECVHMNEGHALPAAFELLQQNKGDLEKTKRQVVFTTHTPVAAGNEVHWVDTLMEGGFFAGCSRERAVELGGEHFSLTVAALRMSRIANAVSQLHGLVANKMWNWVKKGVPLRIEVGPRDIASDSLFVATRHDSSKAPISRAEFLDTLPQRLQAIQDAMFAKAKAYRDASTVSINSKEDFYRFFEGESGGGFALAHYDGSEKVEDMLRNDLKVTVRCIPFDGDKTPGTCIFTGNPSAQRVVFAKSY